MTGLNRINAIINPKLQGQWNSLVLGPVEQPSSFHEGPGTDKQDMECIW
jgi:hypothetical protein